MYIYIYIYKHKILRARFARRDNLGPLEKSISMWSRCLMFGRSSNSCLVSVGAPFTCLKSAAASFGRPRVCPASSGVFSRCLGDFRKARRGRLQLYQRGGGLLKF